MDRRAFLTRCAAAPFVFGLADLFGQDSDVPAWYRAAMKRMKETNRWGVAIVAPPDEAGRERLGETLLSLLENKDPDVREIFCEAVVLCLAPEVADRCIRAAGEKETRFLLDPDGKRVAADSVAPAAFAGRGAFVASFRRFLHGEKNERLRSTVERIRKSLPEAAAVSSAIDELDTDGPAREEPRKTLRTHADRIAPWLVFARMDAVHERGRDACRLALQRLFEEASPERSGPRLPFGSQVFEEPRKDMCQECGRAAAPARSRRFLKFLAQ